jgi:hypothetical protein
LISTLVLAWPSPRPSSRSSSWPWIEKPGTRFSISSALRGAKRSKSVSVKTRAVVGATVADGEAAGAASTSAPAIPERSSVTAAKRVTQRGLLRRELVVVMPILRCGNANKVTHSGLRMERCLDSKTLFRYPKPSQRTLPNDAIGFARLLLRGRFATANDDFFDVPGRLACFVRGLNRSGRKSRCEAEQGE